MNIDEQISTESPLAARMRPRNLDDFIGQEEIVGPGKLLRRAIIADQLGSIILYGPPGTGKTALAHVIANSTKAYFEKLNAVTAGVADIRRLVQEAKDRRGMLRQKTILFIDEIHRFSKSQQDALLPYVEDGTVTLVGATTENPYFEVNPALISRSRIFSLRSLANSEIQELLERAVRDPERGLGKYPSQIAPEAMEHIVGVANGDARSALNALELAVTTTLPELDGIRHVTLEVAEESIQQRALIYDKHGDNHYDTVSAFIKSMRGSDPDAALYWLARMLVAGEDPKFIARRMVICAAEDVGNADPQALVVAVAAVQGLEFVGLPEAQIILSQAVIHIATAPKSNSSLGIFAALSDVKDRPLGRVPVHLRDASYKSAEKLGHGAGYEYSHAFEGNYIPQQYLPDEVANQIYFEPSTNGKEAEIRDRLHRPTQEKRTSG